MPTEKRTEGVLLTGSTGFLGTQIALRLVRERQCTVLAMVRAKDAEAGGRRLQRAWKAWPELGEALDGRVKVVVGDLSKEGLGLSGGDRDAVVKGTTHIIHTAADMRLNGPMDELRMANVEGTRNMLALAREIDADHGLTRLSHVSTAYVAGGRRGDIPEDSLTDEYGFSSRYEMSKYEGEKLIQAAKKELPISVFRPGMVVGDSKTGAIRNFNTLYFPLRLYLTGRLRVIPASSKLKVNMVPVDYIAMAVSKLTFDERARGLNFHLTAPYEKLPTAKDLMLTAHEYGNRKHKLDNKRPKFIPSPTALTKTRYKTQMALEKEDKSVFDGLLTLAPYFNEKRRFRRDNIDRLLGEYDFDWRAVLPPLIDFAVYHGFMHRSERTVYEQVLFRLKSRTRPVTYYDVVDGQIIKRDTEEIRQSILAAAEALRKMGVGPGKRVAITGHNSSRYLIVDTAVGLTGAASVPIYYTSPPPEVDDILEASKADLLLVGYPKLLQRLDELQTDVRIVAFCRTTKPKSVKREIVSWKDFLEMGKGSKGPATAPVDVDAVATIRYTSGTTGRRKGVGFRHHNLKWMAESLQSLLPWSIRTSHIHYLSYLPMSHVVEGLLAAYTPYYAPCKLDICFMEDFKDLTKVLPEYRPNIFFSVPRFYEKVWEEVAKNPTGQRYIQAKPGFKKKMLRKLIHGAVMKKTGLDRCQHLIVGSAPMGQECLNNLSSLGMEVHNAYGLTEAPLVTMNLLGENRIGTVGTPIPETQCRIAEDGEVLFKGPQVTPGYVEDDIPQPFIDGWLATGDLGHLTKEGALVLKGRKRELLVTSYGKNVHPVRAETMLREVPGIDEVMIVGEAKPYITAIIWTNMTEPKDIETINWGVEKVNGFLSHAEAIKHWAVLKNDLGVENGYLTPSLKLKRRAVHEKLGDVIGALYHGPRPKDKILHFGGGEER